MIEWKEKALDTLLKIDRNTKVPKKIIKRVHNISTISFNKVQGESLVLCLSTKNIFTSTGSACHGNKNSGEPILKIMGLSDNIVNGAIRISFNIFNTKDEIDILIDALNHFYPILRGKDIEQ